MVSAASENYGRFGYLRDASWFNSPNKDRRYIPRYHADRGGGQAACSGRPLDENSECVVAGIHPRQLCQLAACRSAFEAASSGANGQTE